MKTRKEQIEDIANEQFCVCCNHYEEAFAKGAEWADENPTEKVSEALRLVDQSWHGKYEVSFVKSEDGTPNAAEELIIEFKEMQAKLQIVIDYLKGNCDCLSIQCDHCNLLEKIKE